MRKIVHHHHCVFLIKLGLLFLLLLAKSCDTAPEDTTDAGTHSDPLILLVSIDGFAADYLDRVETSTLDSLMLAGVVADGLEPVFPSKTFPNHYTQVTGLYPNNHGIISNRMYDPEFEEYFTIGSDSRSARDGKWYSGEPIWVTASRQGLITATMFWPGSDADIMGMRPDLHYAYNGEISQNERVLQVLEWISMGSNRPDMITLYFEQVDQVGHLHGPNSRAVEDAVITTDELLNVLLTGISDLGMARQTNIIIVSDHGMAELSRDRVIFLDDYISLEEVEVINWSPVLEIIPVGNTEHRILNQLKGSHEHLKVYTKGNTPVHWNFGTHSRITPVIGVADAGWSVSSRAYFKQHPNAYTGGAHGYDPHAPSMHGIFIASGPAFQSAGRMGVVSSVHLYELLCGILEITPSENDGNLEVWDGVLNY